MKKIACYLLKISDSANLRETNEHMNEYMRIMGCKIDRFIKYYDYDSENIESDFDEQGISYRSKHSENSFTVCAIAKASPGGKPLNYSNPFVYDTCSQSPMFEFKLTSSSPEISPKQSLLSVSESVSVNGSPLKNDNSSV